MPEVATHFLWPYAASLAVDVCNKHKLDIEDFSALDRISTVNHSFITKDNPHWNERIRVSICLRQSK